MTDIVERLRAGHPYSGMVGHVEIEAADEIERLRITVRAAVDYVTLLEKYDCCDADKLQRHARLIPPGEVAERWREHLPETPS